MFSLVNIMFLSFLVMYFVIEQLSDRAPEVNSKRSVNQKDCQISL